MTADPRTLRVTCPHCAARYLLPANLLGPGGARVRCPGCGRSFDVPAPIGGDDPFQAPPRSSSLPRPRVGRADPARVASAIDVARRVLGELASRGGDAIARAAGEGALFAHFGPEIFEAYDEYRRQSPGEGGAPFRAALRERWGVDLPEVTPRG